MKARELEKLGIPRGPALKLALAVAARVAAGGTPAAGVRERLRAVTAHPAAWTDDAQFGELARALRGAPPSAPFEGREAAAPWRQWGDDLDAQSIQQMQNACALPVSIAGALMPDAHVGYGLPIGGVLATDNAVVPYAVGVDIACRMKLSVLDVRGGPKALEGQADRLIHALERETRFGIGASFGTPHDHPVMDDDWMVSPVTARFKDKARSQLGTSGSGNHFVEFGTLVLETASPDLGLPAGVYLALLSHSGSRGTGASVADHYSKLAMARHPELPRHLRQLAWLDLDSEEGRQYWDAMELMGRYASANHACIHRAIARSLEADVMAGVENHHNFAWKEAHVDPATGQRRTMIVHRKGATPAGAGVLGVIPGSMASPGFVVRGRGSEASLLSAAHGAGRAMSRTQARQSLTWSSVKKQLAERGVTLLSAGLDEAPGVYKDIGTVMAQQRDLVEVVARFDPAIVKMAPAGERPED